MAVATAPGPRQSTSDRPDRTAIAQQHPRRGPPGRRRRRIALGLIATANGDPFIEIDLTLRLVLRRSSRSKASRPKLVVCSAFGARLAALAFLA